jgi:hypothetical protein
VCYQYVVRSPVEIQHSVSDTLLRDIDLPFERVYYPHGFRLNLASNSGEIHTVAEEHWGMFESEHDDPPLTLRMMVQPGDELSPPPVYRAQGHLHSIVGNRENYAFIDFNELFAYAWLTEGTVADHTSFRWFYLEGLVGSMLAQRHAVPMHAACVEKNGIGILLWGPSGMGKSTLSYACACAGWTFIADDSTTLPQNREDYVVTGRPEQARFREDAPRLFPELEGFATSARPAGKPSIEVPVQALPGIRTAIRCNVKRMVFLDRGKTGGLERIGAESALEQMLQNSGAFGAATLARHEKAMRRLLHSPAYRLRYERLDDAIEALESLTA